MKKIDWPGCRVIRYGENYKDNEEEFKEWLDIRRGFIGGSDAGSFNPESRYHSLFSLYMNKVEGVSGFSGTAAAESGNYGGGDTGYYTPQTAAATASGNYGGSASGYYNTPQTAAAAPGQYQRAQSPQSEEFEDDIPF